MAIQLQDSRLQQLVEQMVAGNQKLSQNDIHTLVETAYSDDQKLSTAEKQSLQTLLKKHSDQIESPEARLKLTQFQKMSSAGLRDAAHQFAKDGTITKGEANELKELALRNDRLSSNEKVTLKALMGYYAPQMEPGAEQVLSSLVKTEPQTTHQRPSLSPESQAIFDRIMADDSITTVEIKAAETEIAATQGSEKAKETIISLLGQSPSKIEFEAIDYLQGKIGSMDGHIDGYQNVLTGHLAGAKLLDANFDGKLDKNDLIFSEDANGKINTQKVGTALRDRIVIGDAMVSSAKEMAKAKHRFGDLEFNPVVWESDEDIDNPTTMHLGPDYPASVALMDIFNNPDSYQFECATAQVIVRYRAMLDLIGPKDFDRICDDLRIGVWDQEDHAAEIWKVSGRSAQGEDVSMDEADKSSILPGDYTYFKNWDVTESAKKAGWQGENVVSLGNGKYYGHPFGVVSSEKIIKYLNQNRHAGSTRSASILDLRAQVDAKLLAWDKNPGE